jgi:F0F1-type ATP synthase epsilon subunit
MNNDVFELEIIYRNENEKIEIHWVEIESPTGNFTVGPDHIPLVSLIQERGKITYKKYGDEIVSLDAYKGMFIVANNKARIIFDM